MIDQGLLLSVVAMAVAVAVSSRVARPTTLGDGRVLDAATAPVLVGLLVGRLVAMVLDDPRGLSRPGDILIIRGGVEFWPGVLAGMTVAAVAAKRAGIDVLSRLADLAPHALVAYAVYEAACLIREGCFGPVAAVGLRPEGIPQRQVPIGLFVAIATLAISWAVRRVTATSPLRGLGVALVGVAAVRAVAATWLPRISDGPTRQQLQAVAVLGALMVVAAGSFLARRLRSGAV